MPPAPLTLARCPRCVAERRARRATLAMNVVLGVAVVLGGATCVACAPLTGAMDAGPNYPLADALEDQARAGRLAGYAFAVAWVGVLLKALVDHFARRAARALPSPPADPTAHYRAGPPLPCARHPFAG